MPNIIRVLAFGVVVATALHSGPAFAAEDREGNDITPLDVVRLEPLPNPMGLKPIGAKALAKQRGGTEVASEMVLKGVVSDNRAVNVSTGNNSIEGGALANASGLPIIIQNTGNNVLIQNATIVNVQLK